MKFDIPARASHVLRILTQAGFEAYFVGGCVRDVLRGVPPHDWDICTSARPEQTKDCFSAHKLIETGLQHGTVTVIERGQPYEITTYRTEGPYSDHRRPDYVEFVSSLEADLSRRDFTMNAIAMDGNGGFHDPFGGCADIENRLIRCVGEPSRRFQEDGLRVMRALRFAAVLGYDIEGRTARAIHDLCAVLDEVAVERIHAELCRLLAGPGAGEVLRQYPDVLCRFWPELGPLVALEQHNPWHCWGGWEHTLHALDASSNELIVRLAVLLHDIGKPRCKSTDEQNIDHFYGHAQAGAELADEMLRRLRFDNRTREQVVALVKHHGVQIPCEQRPIRRWLGRLGEKNFFRLLEVMRADSLGQTPDKTTERLHHLQQVGGMAREILAAEDCFSLKHLALSGNDVLAAGIPPGPEVGRVLNFLLEQVMDGAVENRRDSLLLLLRAWR